MTREGRTKTRKNCGKTSEKIEEVFACKEPLREKKMAMSVQIARIVHV